MDDETVELDERTFVDERLDPFSCRPFASRVLSFECLGACGNRRFGAFAFKLAITLRATLHTATLHAASPVSS